MKINIFRFDDTLKGWCGDGEPPASNDDPAWVNFLIEVFDPDNRPSERCLRISDESGQIKFTISLAGQSGMTGENIKTELGEAITG